MGILGWRRTQNRRDEGGPFTGSLETEGSGLLRGLGLGTAQIYGSEHIYATDFFIFCLLFSRQGLRMHEILAGLTRLTSDLRSTCLCFRSAGVKDCTITSGLNRLSENSKEEDYLD